MKKLYNSFKFFILIIVIILFNNCKVQDRYTDSNIVRFGVCTDVHHDLFPDTEDRLKEFIAEANNRKVDFIIQLGDFCFPYKENNNFLETWNKFKGNKYHVLGNHDMDKCTKEIILDFLGMDETKPYYSFDFKNFHFIVLDPNNIYKNGEYLPYEYGNYFKEENINYLTPEQLNWLKEDLNKTSKPCIIFSHQPLNYSVSNKKELFEIFDNPKYSDKIIACFSGHLHKNWYVKENSINYFQINSMCYLWVGGEYMYESRYPDEVEKKYPNLKYMIPYRESLYAFVDIDIEQGILKITGKLSEFIPPGPTELGIKESGIFAPSPSIHSRIITIK